MVLSKSLPSPCPCRPLASHAAVLVAARHDAYVSARSVEMIHEMWPGSEIWYEEGGHVSGFLTLGDTYKKAMQTALRRLEQRQG
jgi:predicted alpha/beta hydrolase family esterase